MKNFSLLVKSDQIDTWRSAPKYILIILDT